MTLTPDIVGLDAQLRLLRYRHEIIDAPHRFAAGRDLYDPNITDSGWLATTVTTRVWLDVAKASQLATFTSAEVAPDGLRQAADLRFSVAPY